jgi:sodium-coupled neutral amino acid transporter 7/8
MNGGPSFVFLSLLQLGLLFFIGASLLVLAWCSDRGGCVNTYQDVMRVCGKNWQRAASVCVVLYCYGTCITFLIIIGDQSDRSKSSEASTAQQYVGLFELGAFPT